MNSADVIIIGAGIHGCSTALHLLKRGKTVLLIEKDTAGRRASGVNAGGVRRLGRALPEIPLSLASLELWYRIDSLVDGDCRFTPCGQVMIAENDEEMRQLEKRAELLKSLGYAHEEVIDQKELRRLVPGVSDHCIGALYCRRDGAAEPYPTVYAFFKKVKQLGAMVYENQPVIDLKRTRGVWEVYSDSASFEAPVVVNCAGAWAGKIAEKLGDTAPVMPRAPVLSVTARVPKFLGPVVVLTGRKLSFKQTQSGTVIIGGGHPGKLEFETETVVIDFEKLQTMAQIVQDIFPLMKDVPIVRFWPGIEGDLPDRMPVIGPSQNAPDVYHAFGFSGHGFQLGPIVGQIMAELIIDGRSSLPIDDFKIERFMQQ